MEDEILALMRSKRSVSETVQKVSKENDTVKFFNAVDEINEDTLRATNVSGTLLAQKVEALPRILRRTNMLTNSTTNSLQIEYPQPKEKNHHDDNKVDTTAIHDDKEDLMVHSDIYNAMGPHSQESKDRELSKLLVNELKGGASETIGDKNAPVISNITFTPENDTSTAMAFIAGNLLNKLWNMEKDTSDDHIDTEVLKHEKIADLLELFQEPLSMRQELFLKNALKQFSTALSQNKNIDNISLCKKIDGKKLFANTDKKVNKFSDQEETDCEKDKQDNEENKNASKSKALNEIYNVLDLIKNYENVQNNLENIKSGKLNERMISTRSNKHTKDITKDEKSSLDLYGKALEKITKLLIPNKLKKNLVNSIQNSNQFHTGKDFESKLSTIKLDNLNIFTKDKIILDYLAHIQSNPDCLLKRKSDKVSLPAIEGNILLNLSEFFKIKSLSDLVKLVEPKELPNPVFRSKETATQEPAKKQNADPIETDSPKQFRDTKERLKGHLKSILEDLVELQKIEGKDTKSKEVLEALPCFYNLLNAGNKDIMEPKITFVKNTTVSDTRPSNKIREIFSNLKNEFKFAQTRRTNILNGPRPKSAVVWERVIKNAEGKHKLQTRRDLGNITKNFEELKVFLDKIEPSGSNAYKNYAYLHKVPAAERLLLLKTFGADTARYIRGLEKIIQIFEAKTNLSNYYVKELDEFLDNVAININLNEKVVKNLDKPKQNNRSIYTYNARSQIRNRGELKLEQPVSDTYPYDTKLSRDQVINQLIKNRLMLYIQSKDAARESYNDMNYDIAKKILLHLEIGNIQLARELYKIFMSNKKKDLTNVENNNIGLTRKQVRLPTRRQPYKMEPLIKFEEKEVQTVNQDHFIKQLLNLKKLKL